MNNLDESRQLEGWPEADLAETEACRKMPGWYRGHRVAGPEDLSTLILDSFFHDAVGNLATAFCRAEDERRQPALNRGSQSCPERGTNDHADRKDLLPPPSTPSARRSGYGPARRSPTSRTFRSA